MNKIFRYYALMLIALIFATTFVARVSLQDNFWMEAAQANMAEVAMGNLGVQKAQSEEVRGFAQRMVTDHTAAGNELQSLASTKNVTLPTDMGPKARSAMDKLSGMSGSDFDRAFMKQMVKDHEAAVKLFQREADRGTDADLKAFASKTLPTLQNHLQMARSISGSTRGGNTSGGVNSNSNSGRDMGSNSNGSNRNSNTSNSNSGNRSNSNGNSTRSTNSNSNSNYNRN